MEILKKLSIKKKQGKHNGQVQTCISFLSNEKKNKVNTMDRFKPVSPSSPNMMMYTFALVPAPLTSPVTTDTSYVLMRAAEETQDRQHYI